MSLPYPEAQDIVIIGVTSDLARRKLLPALYNLLRSRLLPDGSKVIGVSRSDLGDEGLRRLARESINQFSGAGLRENLWEEFASRLQFVRLDAEGHTHLRECVGHKRSLVYLAIPASAAPTTINTLKEAGLAPGASVIVEKPFGHDLASSRELNNDIRKVFHEQQIFRMDHYLGKETVQNILVFRFGNAVFERIWNRDAIDHIQLTVAESIGIEDRGGFYEETGAIRDIVQNHLLQLLSLLAMEAPYNLSSEAIRDEKAKVLHATQLLEPSHIVRGQYERGVVAGKEVCGYREEPAVAPDSKVETYFAAEVCIDTWRWAGVPFYVRTGKRLARRDTEIVVAFKDVPLCLFEETGLEEIPPNRLVLQIQPNEGIFLRFQAKLPGPEIKVQEVSMDFQYSRSFMSQPAEAYERLLYDAMRGDHTLYTRWDSIERSWAIVEPALKNPSPLCSYQAGSWGPAEADLLLANRRWNVTQSENLL